MRDRRAHPLRRRPTPRPANSDTDPARPRKRHPTADVCRDRVQRAHLGGERTTLTVGASERLVYHHADRTLDGLPERNRAASFRSRSTICRTRWSEIPCCRPIALYVLLASLSRKIARSRRSNAASRATRPGSSANRRIRPRACAGEIHLPSVNPNDSTCALSSSHSDCGVETTTSRGQRTTTYSPASRPTGLRLKGPLMPRTTPRARTRIDPAGRVRGEIEDRVARESLETSRPGAPTPSAAVGPRAS